MKSSKTGRSLSILGLSLAAFFLNSCANAALLQPKGPVGHEEKFLILTAIGLMLIVIVPVFVMVVLFSVRYRASNKKATFRPEWEFSKKIEIVIWAVPVAIVAILAWLTVTKTAELDPYKPLASASAPLHVQVVSLDWNWLFIYPDYDLATVNQLVVPSGVPISFDLTSATVMTSFFIPRLGSQMYAMAGMTTHLNLLASEPGTYRGQNQEFSGEGYESMHFPVLAEPTRDFETWTKEAKGAGKALDLAAYEALSAPKAGYPATIYSSVAPGLFERIVGQYRDWAGGEGGMVGGGAQSGAMGMPAGDQPRTQDN